ncbi:MAG: tyrosine-type recombinase/integrase [Limnobacter sp.]
MAYISQRGDFWRVEVRRKGHKPIYRTFDTRKQAQQWASKVELEIQSGAYIDNSLAEKMTFRDALQKYLDEIVPEKRHPYQEERRVRRWMEHDLAHRMLASLRGVDFAKYRDQRRMDGRAENTIRLELQLISHLYEMARKEWGMEALINPLNSIRKPSGSSARDRRLMPGEYDRIKDELSVSRNPFVVPAFDLAIETGLRQGTLFSLQWEWVDLDKRLVTFPNSVLNIKNKGVPPILPLSIKASQVMEGLLLKRREIDENDGWHEVLPTTANAVICVWKEALKRLGIADLRWHDLRHEATSRLFEKGLHPLEVASITGHRSMQMLKRYTHLQPSDLLLKLG